MSIFLQVLSRILYAPGKGIVTAIVMALGRGFGTVMQCFDSSLIFIAVVIGLIFVGELTGVREGSVFAAFAVGGLVKVHQRIYGGMVRRKLHP